MANEPNVIWTKPEGCTCGYEKNVGTNGTVTLIRVSDPTCPLHGELFDVLDYLEKVILDHLKTVPGGSKVSPAMASRILRALIPALLQDETLAKLVAAQGYMPMTEDVIPVVTEGEV